MLFRSLGYSQPLSQPLAEDGERHTSGDSTVLNAHDEALYRAETGELIQALLSPSNQFTNSDTYDIKGLTMQTTEQLQQLKLGMEGLVDDGVCGDVYETGIWRGGTAIFMVQTLRKYERLRGSNCHRNFWFFDSFEGFKGATLTDELLSNYLAKNIYTAPLESVTKSFESFGIVDDASVHLVKGYFEETMPSLNVSTPIALLRLDGDLYSSTNVVLEALYDKVMVGGAIVIDDYNWRPSSTAKNTKVCREAVDEFRKSQAIAAPMTNYFGNPAWYKE
mmetsp:Transcript_24185/g.52156  ORF Transcript_24185/g.52156 Transcript_24185/m.52156 type:complete len:277 (+) Transcript_24185:127-957(+)